MSMSHEPFVCVFALPTPLKLLPPQSPPDQKTQIHQAKKLKFFDILRYRFRLRFWFRFNLYRGIRVSGFGGFEGGSIFSGSCHTLPRRFWEVCSTLQRLYSTVVSQESLQRLLLDSYGAVLRISQKTAHEEICCVNWLESPQRLVFRSLFFSTLFSTTTVE